MPFKSQAQRRKFAELLVKGEISAETFEEWNRETGSAKLPEYASAKTRRRSKGSGTSRRKAGPTRVSNRKARSKSKAKSRPKRSRTRK